MLSKRCGKDFLLGSALFALAPSGFGLQPRPSWPTSAARFVADPPLEGELQTVSPR